MFARTDDCQTVENSIENPNNISKDQHTVYVNEQTMNVLHCRRSFTVVLIMVLARFRSTTLVFIIVSNGGYNDMQAVTRYFAILVKGIKRTKRVAMLND